MPLSMVMRNLLSGMSIAAAGAVLSLPALAAPPADSNGSIRPVVLPVTVRDKKGGLVESLQKNDLTLTVDKKPQAIVSLSKAADQPLRIGLIVDTSKAMANALDAERKAADKFIDAELPAGSHNQLFLIHFDREVELLEDFTGSAEKLH